MSSSEVPNLSVVLKNCKKDVACGRNHKSTECLAFVIGREGPQASLTQAQWEDLRGHPDHQVFKRDENFVRRNGRRSPVWYGIS